MISSEMCSVAARRRTEAAAGAMIHMAMRRGFAGGRVARSVRIPPVRACEKDSRHKARIEEVGDGPQPSLGTPAEVGFHEHGIREEAEQGSGVREGVPVIAALAAAPSSPDGLQERTGAGEQQVLQSDGGGEHEQNAADGFFAANRLPVRRRDDWQQEEAGGKQKDVGFPAPETVGIEISAEEGSLEEHERGRPDARAASEPGEDEPGDQGLNLKEEECAEKDGGAEQPGGRESAARVARIIQITRYRDLS